MTTTMKLYLMKLQEVQSFSFKEHPADGRGQDKRTGCNRPSISNLVREKLKVWRDVTSLDFAAETEDLDS